VFRRYGDNVARLDRIEHSRGFVPYPTLPATDRTGPEARLDGFTPTKLQIASFERTLVALHDSGVPVALLRMPIKRVTRDAMPPSAEAAYLGYLRSLSARFPNVELIGASSPAWPSAMFTDDVHLNATGAEQFSARLGACVEGASIRTDCDLDWDARVSRVGLSTGTR
jgi:hypothetical protein